MLEEDPLTLFIFDLTFLSEVKTVGITSRSRIRDRIKNIREMVMGS